MRLYILILFILFSFSLSGQYMMLAVEETAPISANLLLDDYPGAIAAYSLRELSTSWAGQDVIRVRESGSNTSQDFTAAEIIDGTLATFCGANDGFVVTWYDQSGNGNDATQGTTSFQPQIVSAGSVMTEGGKPIIKAADDTRILTIPISSTSINDLFATISLDNSDDWFHTTLSDGSSSFFLNAQNGSTATVLQGNVGSPSYYRNGSIYTGPTRDDVYDDFQGQNVLSIIGASPTLWPKVNIGYRQQGPIKMANIQEIIIYSSDQSANRTAIESNINGYYNIYP